LLDRIELVGAGHNPIIRLILNRLERRALEQFRAELLGSRKALMAHLHHHRVDRAASIGQNARTLRLGLGRLLGLPYKNCPFG
jgi:hypothetical protein